MRLSLLVPLTAAVVAVTPAASAGDDDESSKSKSKAATHLVLIWEDAPLYTEPDDSGTYVIARERVLPRAQRPFLWRGRQGEWVIIESFSTADIGRFPICPLPGLTDLQVRLYVHEDDVAKTIPLSRLPKRPSAVLEFQTDPCRNPNARPMVEVIDRLPSGDGDQVAVPELEAPLIGFGPYLPPGTQLSWPDGRPAGRTRFNVFMPVDARRDNERICWQRDMLATGYSTSARPDTLTFCASQRALRTGTTRVRTESVPVHTY